MVDRTQHEVVTFTSNEGTRQFSARVDQGTAEIKVQTVETYTTVLIRLEDLPSLVDFLGAVSADSTPGVVDSTPEEDSNG